MKFKEFSDKKENVFNWIHKHLDLIDENKWTEVYEYLNRGIITHNQVTESFYEAGIDPLDYLDYIPEDYLSNNPNVTEIEIPDHINSINDSAFYGCLRVTDIELPKSVVSIGDYALAGMDNLKSIYIPGKLDYLSALGIYLNDNIEKIYSIAENKAILKKNVSEIKNGTCKFVEID